MVKLNEVPVIVCTQSGQDEPLKFRKLLFTHSELNLLISTIQNEVQSCQQALNDENDKRDMYKVSTAYYLTSFPHRPT